jgi:hypothetical protein
MPDNDCFYPWEGVFMKKETIGSVLILIGVLLFSVTAVLQAVLPPLLDAYYLANVRNVSTTTYPPDFKPAYFVAGLEVLLGIMLKMIRKNP